MLAEAARQPAAFLRGDVGRSHGFSLSASPHANRDSADPRGTGPARSYRRFRQALRRAEDLP